MTLNYPLTLKRKVYLIVILIKFFMKNQILKNEMKDSKGYFYWHSKVFSILSLMFLIVFLTINLSAQENRPVKGTVTDETGQPLPGVTVIVKGTTQGTVTNADGNFSLAIPSDTETLQFSFVGMQTQEVAIEGRTTFTVVMEEETIGLEEVVAIGYGTKRKQDITSAISVIDTDNIGDIPASNSSRLLQGQAAGVVVKQQSGTPGEQMNVTIRGVGSLGAGSDPLYVIDGFAVGTSIGENLNPNDIESISILKDAASTAIYGARGSNGVVLITTKNAKQGELDLTLTAHYGYKICPIPEE
jgi:TonB-dependent starch-binding outer membrane protein SusC